MSDRSSPFRPELLLEHTGWVQALARNLVQDEAQAEDLAQETFLAALESPPRSTQSSRGEVGGIRAWLATVLRNRARSRYRSDTRRRRRELECKDPPPSPPTPEEVLERAELHRSLVDEVLSLREPYRTTLLLRYFEGYEPSQIAVLEETTAATIRSRLKRGLELLRGRLDRHYGDRKRWSGVMLALAERGEHPPVPPTPTPAPVPTETVSTLPALISWSLPVILVAVVAGGGAFLVRRADESSPDRRPESIPTTTNRDERVARPVPPNRSDEASGGATEEADALAAPTTLGRIRGRVTDRDGAPQVGAEVHVLATPFTWRESVNTERRVYSVFISHPFHDSVGVWTDAGGEFSVEDLRPGQYSLAVRAPGCRTAQLDSIEVHPGETVEVAVSVQPGLVIEGIVVGPAGDPIEGAEVVATSGGHVTGSRVMVTLDVHNFVLAQDTQPRVATTDATGRFRLDGLREGEHSLVAFHKSFGSSEPVSVTSGSFGAELRLQRGRRLSGTVRSRSGAPIPEAVVSVSASIPQLGATTRTDASGYYRFDSIARSPATLTVVADGFVPFRVTGPEIPGEADVRGYDITLDEGSRVSGRIVDERAAPIPGVRIVAYPVNSLDPIATLRETVSDGEGVFSLHGLRPGESYRWRFEHSRFAPLESDAFDIEELYVELGDIELSRGSTLKGVVHDASGAPIPRAAITLVPSEFPDSRFAAVTDPDGRFRIAAVPDGTYRVRAKARGFAPVLSEVVSVNDREGAEDVILEVPAGSITGVVSDDQGQPLAGARVTITRDDPPLWITTRTDRSGAFAVSGLGESSLEVEVSYADLSVQRLHGIEVGGDPLVIQLSPRAAITGVVRAAGSGAVVQRFTVRLQRLDPSVGPATARAQWSELGSTSHSFDDLEGRFTIEDVDLGEYRVVVTAPGYLPHTREDIVVRSPRDSRLAVFLEAATPISGRIVDADGAPIPGASIALETEEADEPRSASRRIQLNVGSLKQGSSAVLATDIDLRHTTEELASADADGRFELTAVPPGRHRFRVSHPDHVDRIVGPYAIGEEPVTLPDVVLRDGARLAGTVYGGNGEPWSGGFLFLKRTDGKAFHIMTVNDEGEYDQRGLAAGRYDILPCGALARSQRITLANESEPVATVHLAADEVRELDLHLRDPKD